MYGMFREAGLKKLDLRNFNTSNITRMDDMFISCSSNLKGQNETTWTSSRRSGAYAIVDGKDGKTGYLWDADTWDAAHPTE